VKPIARVRLLSRPQFKPTPTLALTSLPQPVMHNHATEAEAAPNREKHLPLNAPEQQRSLDIARNLLRVAVEQYDLHFKLNEEKRKTPEALVVTSAPGGEC
jgi:hypothetical protein